MVVTEDDVALLEWTRCRMIGRACWVAAATFVGPMAATGLMTNGELGPLLLLPALLGGLLAWGAFRGAASAYGYDVDRLIVERMLRRRDRAWRLDPEGDWPATIPGPSEPLFTAEGEGLRIGARRLPTVDLWFHADGRSVSRPREARPSLFRPVSLAYLERQAADLARLLESTAPAPGASRASAGPAPCYDQPMPELETAILGAGCFWCVEAVFDDLKGVVDVESGYAGGHVEHPTYEQVCGKATGHVEVVKIAFDPAVLAFKDLLRVFFAIHDPTTKDQQGADVGPQYRSAIFALDDRQAAEAREVIAEVDGQAIYPRPIATVVAPYTNYFPAEKYHQEYFATNPLQPYCMAVVAPKVAKFRKQFLDRLKG
jgi:peptide-methionine (S)-S-oxide reductase